MDEALTNVERDELDWLRRFHGRFAKDAAPAIGEALLGYRFRVASIQADGSTIDWAKRASDPSPFGAEIEEFEFSVVALMEALFPGSDQPPANSAVGDARIQSCQERRNEAKAALDKAIGRRA